MSGAAWQTCECLWNRTDAKHHSGAGAAQAFEGARGAAARRGKAVTSEPAKDLADMARALLRAVPGGGAFLDHWLAAPGYRTIAPSRLPVTCVLPGLAALASTATRGIVERLAEAAERLAWRQTYGPEDFGVDFLERYGWTELVGLRGPIASERVACGFLLLGAGTDYPSHAHEAEELYVPLAGTAFWQRGAGPWTARAPGEAIHHPPWTAHAMRTAAEPLLALYVWRGGDLAAKSTIVDS